MVKAEEAKTKLLLPRTFKGFKVVGQGGNRLAHLSVTPGSPCPPYYEGWIAKIRSPIRKYERNVIGAQND